MRTILCTMLLLLSYLAQAQLTISTNLREDGIYDDANDEWIITDSTEGLTVFTFNSKLTFFRHITDVIASVYKIDDWTYDEDESLYDMEVTSDAGNKYDFRIDGLSSVVIFFYYDHDDNFRMVRHSIKETWFDEEE